MADELIQTQEAVQTVETQVQDTIPQELRDMMNISLNGGVPPEKVDVPHGTPEEQVPPPETEEVVDANEYLKTNLGYESWEAAKAEIEELRQLKANPTKAEIKYENEVSRKLAEAWMAGKTDEVYDYLNEQRQLERLTTAEVSKDTADEIIKLGMKLRYKDEGLNETEIAYKFNKQYSIPKEPVELASETAEEFEQRHNDWKEQVADIEMSKIIDAKVAKRDLEAAKQKLVLPTVETSVDEDYIQYKKDLEESAKIDEETKIAYKAFTPEAVEAKMNFNDEANKIAFEFQYKPTQEEFAQAVEMVTNPEKFWGMYKNSDGSPNRQKFLQDIQFLVSREKMTMEAMKQAKNATIKQMLLADNSQSGQFQRQPAQQGEPSEIHKLMQQAGVVN